MALYSLIEQGMFRSSARGFSNLAGLVDLPEFQLPLPPPSRHHLQFTYNPFPYLPPELIVSILSQTPADAIPSLYQTNHFFQLHIDIYKYQLIKIRCRRYPPEILSAYCSVHAIDFDSIHYTTSAWQTTLEIRTKGKCMFNARELVAPQCGCAHSHFVPILSRFPTTMGKSSYHVFP